MAKTAMPMLEHEEDDRHRDIPGARASESSRRVRCVLRGVQRLE
jgi:hypothetical protein